MHNRVGWQEDIIFIIFQLLQLIIHSSMNNQNVIHEEYYYYYFDIGKNLLNEWVVFCQHNEHINDLRKQVIRVDLNTS